MAASTPYHAITLTENDVPGAKFVYSSIEKHSNTQLMRWLECRGLPKNGNRSKLLKRVHSCIQAGEQNHIVISIDDGKWYDAKLKGARLTAPPSSNVPLLPYCGWGKFPSKEIPKNFNNGHIHHHIVESVQFTNQMDVCIGDDDSDSDERDIEDVHTSKPLKKGLTFFQSGHVQKMQDCSKSGHYFLKAKVMASYRAHVLYDVTVTLSKATGFVRDASCTCVASAMGRCSHVTALLYALLDYIGMADKQPEVACTSELCTWNQGRKKNKQPKRVQDSLYTESDKNKRVKVIDYEPRASSTVPTDEQLNDRMIYQSEAAEESESMWVSVLAYNYKDYAINSDHETVLQDQAEQLLESLKVQDSNFPVPLVKMQGTDEWRQQRRLRLTASNCKAVSSFKSVHAISSFLNRKLWNEETVSTSALVYGISNEAVARRSYQASQDGNTLKVIETGMWVDGKYPELAASPDGLILDLKEPSHYSLLEIKCPKVLEGKSISEFRELLSKKQLQQFCLEVTGNGEINLKCSHAYYSQIQMQMGVTGLTFCDFVVWSSKDLFVKRIRFDRAFWENLREKLVKFHHSYLCPEYFEMRIPRGLLPYQLE